MIKVPPSIVSGTELVTTFPETPSAFWKVPPEMVAEPPQKLKTKPLVDSVEKLGLPVMVVVPEDSTREEEPAAPVKVPPEILRMERTFSKHLEPLYSKIPPVMFRVEVPWLSIIS